SYIYTSHTHINLFDLRPLYSFSKLAAQTSIILITTVYVSVSTAPAALDNPALVAGMLGPVIVAAVTFIWPLWGIHRLLVEEKDKILSGASRRMEATISDLDKRVDTHDLSNVEQTKTALEALIMKQTVLEKIPTWPWSSETPRLIA